MKITKSKILAAYLLPVAFLAFAASQPAFTVFATGVAPTEHFLSSFSAIAMMWVLILAGSFAILASSSRIGRAITLVLGLVSLWEIYVLTSHYLSFPNWLSDSIYAEGDRAYVHLGSWVAAGLGLLLAFTVSISAFMSAPHWQTTRKYDRNPTPTNPWAAIDQGIDPTIE